MLRIYLLPNDRLVTHIRDNWVDLKTGDFWTLDPQMVSRASSILINSTPYRPIHLKTIGGDVILTYDGPNHELARYLIPSDPRILTETIELVSLLNLPGVELVPEAFEKIQEGHLTLQDYYRENWTSDLDVYTIGGLFAYKGIDNHYYSTVDLTDIGTGPAEKAVTLRSYETTPIVVIKETGLIILEPDLDGHVVLFHSIGPNVPSLMIGTLYLQVPLNLIPTNGHLIPKQLSTSNIARNYCEKYPRDLFFEYSLPTRFLIYDREYNRPLYYINDRVIDARNLEPTREFDIERWDLLSLPDISNQLFLIQSGDHIILLESGPEILDEIPFWDESRQNQFIDDFYPIRLIDFPSGEDIELNPETETLEMLQRMKDQSEPLSVLFSEKVEDYTFELAEKQILLSLISFYYSTPKPPSLGRYQLIDYPSILQMEILSYQSVTDPVLRLIAGQNQIVLFDTKNGYFYTTARIENGQLSPPI